MVTASDWEMVRVYTSAALKGRPGDASLKAQVLFAEGQIAYLRGDYREALSAFDAAAREAPEMAAPHVGRGNVYLVNNQSAEALKAFRRAAELDPHLALAHRGMGDALTKQGKIKEAAGYHNRAKVLSLTSAALKSARELKKRALWAEALREFQGVAAARQTADLYIDIGDCYVGLGQSADAARAYRRATELDPNAAPAHYKYGEAMYGLDEFAAAAEALERALALDPSGTSIDRARARELADSAAEKARRMN